MPKSFTEKERAAIYEALHSACKRSWTERGYKKTSVDELCRSAGISKGAFYLFYDTKESLFCEVISVEQNRICDAAEQIMKEDIHVTGVMKALKRVYRMYDENKFLYQSDTQDYTLLLDKLSEEQKRQLLEVQNRSRQLFLKHEYLIKKKDDDTISSVIYALIMINKEKDRMLCDHFRVFDILADNIIRELFEEGQKDEH